MVLPHEEEILRNKLGMLCNNKGCELEPHDCAVIFNELGLLYRKKSPDRISLIQSAALLNAAIVRQPSNQKFLNDLRDLCAHVMSCANTNCKGSNDLLTVANSAKLLVKEMRDDVEFHLNNITKISDNELEPTKLLKKKTMDYANQVKALQNWLSSDYTDLMAFISRQCIDLMGPPPCKYALVGMGSLARKEITPYSDFEHILILENCDFNANPSFKEYFRWYTTLFHIVVINLGETIIPSVYIQCFNSRLNPHDVPFYDQVTTRGISFDGMMPHACKFPLGRTKKTKEKPWTTELIKPVDEMVRYLDKNEDLKNGYQLGDILTRTCFVEGNAAIYDNFFEKVQAVLKRLAAKPSLFIVQLDKDLKNFDIIENLSALESEEDINIKRIVYRSTTLFVSALGRLNNLNANSGFEIIEELRFKRKINNDTALRLSFAVAVSCHVRLFHYMSRKRQDDNILNDKTIPAKQKLKNLTKAVNVHSLTKCLTTGFFLQFMLKNKVNLSKYDRTLQEIEPWSHIRFLSILEENAEGIRYGENILKKKTNFEEKDIDVLYHLVRAYCKVGQQEEALKLFLNIEELVSIKNQQPLRKFHLDPHYRKADSYQFKRKLKECLWNTGGFILKVVALFMFTYALLYCVCWCFDLL